LLGRAAHHSHCVDFRAGDVRYVPFAMGHHIENTGTTKVRFLEIFRSNQYADVSLDTWMALTPPELLKARLNLDPQVMAALRKTNASIFPA
jgi:oxalate decarboxylase